MFVWQKLLSFAAGVHAGFTDPAVVGKSDVAV